VGSEPDAQFDAVLRAYAHCEAAPDILNVEATRKVSWQSEFRET
jgi:hypothetical protein